jgi:hypothetical protein
MVNTAKRQYLESIRSRYHASSRTDKKRILDEFCTICGYHRKHAIRLLNGDPKPIYRTSFSRRGPKKTYADPLLHDVLRDLWVITNLPCSKRLKAIIPLWLPHYDKYEVPDSIREKLMTISASTIDRIMAPSRAKYTKRGLSTTKPGSVLKKFIPINTNQWNEKVPGFLEADTVAHCGSTTAGSYVFTIDCVDIATGWTEQRAIWCKGERGVVAALQDIEQSLPFELKGFDCDNGSEFLNWHLLRHFSDRKKPVQFTRSRPYYKNDNAHIENKNWTNIRQYLGYQRFENIEITAMLNQLYTSEWNLYFNFFIPSVKLISKTRVGSKTIKEHDAPKTPVQRLFESQHISNKAKDRLQHQRKTLNPFTLREKMFNKIKAILKVVNYTPQNPR